MGRPDGVGRLDVAPQAQAEAAGQEAVMDDPILKADLGDAKLVALLRDDNRAISECAASCIERLSAALKAAESENACDVCCGTGDPGTGAPCMCGGTGRMSDAARALRGMLVGHESRRADDDRSTIADLSRRLAESEGDYENAWADGSALRGALWIATSLARHAEACPGDGKCRCGLDEVRRLCSAFECRNFKRAPEEFGRQKRPEIQVVDGTQVRRGG